MRPQRSPASPLAALRLLALACLACRAGAGISCYGDSGRPVDWFIVYKLPKLEKTSLEGAQRGAVGRTLQQLYGSTGTRKEDVAHVLYNDQPPAAFDPSNGGHTKGVVLLDKAQGFWLVHSAPHFPPPAKEGFSWPGSGRHNGQSFLCVTYAYRQFKDIGLQLRYNDIFSYDFSIADSFAQELPDLLQAAEREHLKAAPWNRQVTLTSLAGKEFISFSKYGLFHDDLYSGWLSGALKADLLVQFWLNSRGILPSNCSSPHHVYDVEQVSFSPELTFSSHLDHSKWCVSNSSSAAWACVGDMNRNQEEEKRAGGTVCTGDARVWKSFRRLVSRWSQCDRRGAQREGGRT
ncbi:deoxyribonuclease-2-alpha [Rhinatrema bivittatum]|uniref:deoxyribonuclease-2-alpha n=1 Tax=Rhinatrema bivittatum TaxID=194408 RepID=UPI00112C8780|nr:deoxyribonuclease-2-alpha [Rhinatrema bivittatum]